ncbi:collagen-like protein [Enterococcus sp. AZ126]|uniref:collagen-like protein n=1 Tax=Enterococcus sp. AZ126 TaxID=2774635 RepID=UPI003F271B5A
MTDIVELKNDGALIYPKTHVNAVEGITTIKGEKGETGATGATGPQGPAGTNATTTAVATQTVNGLMSAVDKKKLDTLPTITFNKVGSV